VPDTLETRVARLEQRLTDELEHLRVLRDDLRRVPEDLAITKERAATAIRSSRECLSAVERVESTIQQREREQSKERKSDRRWLIGTVLTSAALIIAALGLLVG
jgi:predicted RNA-binding protein with PIN domain